jgi:hypothetical protein
MACRVSRAKKKILKERTPATTLHCQRVRPQARARPAVRAPGRYWGKGSKGAGEVEEWGDEGVGGWGGGGIRR